MLIKSIVIFFIVAISLYFFADPLVASVGSQFAVIGTLLVGMLLEALVFSFSKMSVGSASSKRGNTRFSKGEEDQDAAMLIDSGTIYVGNLPYKISEQDVRGLFAQYGAVSSVRLMRDRKTSRFRGFGFVEMTPDDALVAIRALSGNEFMGRKLKVNLANEKNR
jgi:RNA recognition motif-containing protein